MSCRVGSFLYETPRPLYDALSLLGARLRVLGAATPRLVFYPVLSIDQSFELRRGASGILVAWQQLTNKMRLVGMSLAG